MNLQRYSIFPKIVKIEYLWQRGRIGFSLEKGKTFTVGFGGEDNWYSEISHAEELKKSYPLKCYSKIIRKDDFWHVVPQVAYYLDEPSGDDSAIALYFVAREASRHVKVVWSGEGADEFFGGYNIYREPDALKWMDWIPTGGRRKIWTVYMFLVWHHVYFS